MKSKQPWLSPRDIINMYCYYYVITDVLISRYHTVTVAGGETSFTSMLLGSLIIASYFTR